MGANIIPMMKSVGRTVLGVSMGCHALSLCCLNAVLAGRFQLPFSLFSEESAESESCLFLSIEDTQ